jgi:hypothetical protein
MITLSVFHWNKFDCLNCLFDIILRINLLNFGSASLGCIKQGNLDMQLNDPWQPWFGSMGQKRAPLGLNQGDMGKKQAQYVNGM